MIENESGLESFPEETDAPTSMIIGSHSKEMIEKLCKLGDHRNYFSHSISRYDVENHGLFSVNRGRGDISLHKIDKTDVRDYYIVERDVTKHRFTPPANVYNKEHENLLWLSGFFKGLDSRNDDMWPLRKFLKFIVQSGTPPSVEGAFSCVYSDGMDLFIFRNELGSLFCDKELTFCTTPWVGSVSVDPNMILKLDFIKKKLVIVGYFQTMKKLIRRKDDVESKAYP